MKKITIEELKLSVDWEWFPLEYVLGNGYAMQFRFVDYDEQNGFFMYRNGHTGRDLILSLDNVTDDKHTIIKAWMFGADLYELDSEGWVDQKEDEFLYEVPMWFAMQVVLEAIEPDAVEIYPGIPFILPEDEFLDEEDGCTGCGACSCGEEDIPEEEEPDMKDGQYLN